VVAKQKDPLTGDGKQVFLLWKSYTYKLITNKAEGFPRHMQATV